MSQGDPNAGRQGQVGHANGHANGDGHANSNANGNGKANGHSNGNRPATSNGFLPSVRALTVAQVAPAPIQIVPSAGGATAHNGVARDPRRPPAAP